MTEKPPELPNGELVSTERTGLHGILDRMRGSVVSVASSIVASGDEDEILRRGLQRIKEQVVRDQENVDAVVDKVEKIIEENPPPLNAKPDALFIHRFQKEVVNASTEEARDMFAKVLSGELNKAGSFSILTLDILSNMDTNLAKCVKDSASWFSPRGATFGTSFGESTAGFAKLSRLQTRGLVHPGEVSMTSQSMEKIVRLPLPEDRLLVVEVVKPPLKFQGYMLTAEGREIFSLVDAFYDKDVIDAAVETLKADSNVRKISIENGGGALNYTTNFGGAVGATVLFDRTAGQ